MNRKFASVLSIAVLATGIVGVQAPTAGAAAETGAPRAAACSYTVARPTLRPGATGTAVMQAQCLSNLWTRVAKLKVDGVYGPLSVNKIKWIQGCRGLVKDGLVGPKTWNALSHPVTRCH